MNCKLVLQKLVIKPDSPFYIIWSFIRFFFSLIEFILYLYITAQGYETSEPSSIIVILAISELFFVADLILNFFIAYKKWDTDDTSYTVDIEKTSSRYINSGSFYKDLFIVLPLGWIG